MAWTLPIFSRENAADGEGFSIRVRSLPRPTGIPPTNPPGRAMLSHPSPDESPEAESLRGKLFNDLDRLAFALEMETAALLEEGDTTSAKSRQDLRLGVRLAQRLVSGVWADEVNRRIQQHAEAYEARLGRVA
jgi:hypothetical protein